MMVNFTISKNEQMPRKTCNLPKLTLKKQTNKKTQP